MTHTDRIQEATARLFRWIFTARPVTCPADRALEEPPNVEGAHGGGRHAHLHREGAIYGQSRSLPHRPGDRRHTTTLSPTARPTRPPLLHTALCVDRPVVFHEPSRSRQRQGPMKLGVPRGLNRRDQVRIRCTAFDCPCHLDINRAERTLKCLDRHHRPAPCPPRCATTLCLFSWHRPLHPPEIIPEAADPYYDVPS
jgi:hypothetical protein